MKTPREIYAEFRIMPNLQLHQLRVAAVAKLICGNLKQPVNTNDVVLACLFHDMGNILKSDLATFPEFLEPQGREYWENVKTDFISKYGTNAHEGNVAISRELLLPAEATRYIDGMSFSWMRKTAEGSSFEQKICEYADMRVGPYGVLPMRQRLAEARERYVAANSGKPYYSEDGFKELATFAEQIERQIFQHVSIRPGDITDEALAPLIEELWEYPVS